MTTEIEQALLAEWPKEVVRRRAAIIHDPISEQWWNAYWAANPRQREVMFMDRKRETDKRPRWRCSECGEYSCHIKHPPPPRTDPVGDMEKALLEAFA